MTIGNPIEFVFFSLELWALVGIILMFSILQLSTQLIQKFVNAREIGRGLRICVKPTRTRVYDALNAEDADRVNQLTVIPNETYETFVTLISKRKKDILRNNWLVQEYRIHTQTKPQNEVSLNIIQFIN